ncbi:MAG: DUF3047 domain-containing protein [Deltaproteobacteria bacterium]|nr:DUF3047 domain-containing protein [Deltaproteobacteria bacterium]
MNKSTVVLLTFSFWSGICSNLPAEERDPGPPNAPLQIENFSNSFVQKFPRHFRTFPFQGGKARQVYEVREENGNRYLAGKDDQDISIQIFRRFHWELEKHPIFQWRWRARLLPQGAKESEPTKNDSACGVYVVFGGYTGNSLKYVWSSSLSVGTVAVKKPGKAYFVVMNRGSPGSWQEIKVDVLNDYQRIFKEKPRANPIGFGILTDGNATHSPSACDYDDFAVSRS